MPSVSVRQQHFMGMELNKKKHGIPTRTGMSMEQLKEFAGTSTKGLPYRAASGVKKRRHAIAKIRAGRK